MDNMQMVEKLREYVNVTYEEAKAALDEADGDAKVMAPVIQREYHCLAYDYLLTEDEAKFIIEIINYSCLTMR